MKRAYIMLRPDVLAQLLDLPEGVNVHSVNANWLMDGIEVMLEGDGLPAGAEYVRGTVPMNIGVSMVVTDEGRIQVEWQ